jgi:hypothetical protein
MFTSRPQQWFTLCRLAAILMAPLAAACGGDNDPTGPGSPPPAPTGTAIRMTNQSSRAAWYVYFRTCGTEDFGEDRLGISNVLSSNEAFTSSVDPGCYDVLATSDPTEAPYYQALWQNLTVGAGQQTPLAITESSWEQVAQLYIGRLGVSRGK